MRDKENINCELNWFFINNCNKRVVHSLKNNDDTPKLSHEC